MILKTNRVLLPFLYRFLTLHKTEQRIMPNDRTPVPSNLSLQQLPGGAIAHDAIQLQVKRKTKWEIH